MTYTEHELTELLARVTEGTEGDYERLYHMLEGELRKIANRQLRYEQTDNSLQATMLINDAFLRLLGPNRRSNSWADRKHFFRTAAKLMRRIRTDHARRRKAKKRLGRLRRVDQELECLQDRQPNSDQDLLVDDQLRKFAEVDPRLAEVVELRYFGGYSNAEIADLIGVSVSTVKNDVAVARSKLIREYRRDRSA